MAFKFGEWWQLFIVEFSASDVCVESLIGGCIKVVIATSADGSFDNLGISVWNACMITIAGECANAVQI